RPHAATALLEDGVVPAPALAESCRGLQHLVDAHDYAVAVIFVHANDGSIPFLRNAQLGTSSSRLDACTEHNDDPVLRHVANFNAEDGTGRLMAPFVERQYGPALYAVMREIKTLVHPTGVLNPGVVLTEDPSAHMQNLKPVVEVEEEVDRCVECGYCEP